VLIPPTDPKTRRRYFALKAKAASAPLHQRVKLLSLARGLMISTPGHELQARRDGSGRQQSDPARARPEGGQR
jgi:hypothetical protein